MKMLIVCFVGPRTTRSIISALFLILYCLCDILILPGRCCDGLHANRFMLWVVLLEDLLLNLAAIYLLSVNMMVMIVLVLFELTVVILFGDLLGGSSESW